MCRIAVDVFFVSIHAPAWGATKLRRTYLRMILRFNPRTRVGCDSFLTPSRAYENRFQSTHPRGVRRAEPLRDVRRRKVSIHAPAWGATPLPLKTGGGRRGFNPRTRVGCDAWRGGLARLLGVFQSTHPRGVRHAPAVSVDVLVLVSIHAPAWGATRPACRHRHRVASFNPRTRVGCDPY